MSSLAFAVLVLVISVCFSAVSSAQVAKPAALGETQILKWKDGKKAVFLLAFDDSCVTHLNNAIPELEKRNLVGTFYINAGNGPYKSQETRWKQAAQSPAVVLGNHTYTHVGATAPDQLDDELAKANEVIASLTGRDKPALVSFAQPGGVPWKVDKEIVKQLLAKHNLITRPPFGGPPFQHKTLADAMQLIDTALAKGEMSHLDLHGVGGDWHVVPMDYYIPLLDRLQAQSHQLWTTDHITYQKYQAQRTSAKVALVAAGEKEIRLTLSSDLDPSLYDQPLTLTTAVPPTWTSCTVRQGALTRQITPKDGIAMYDAFPGTDEIRLSPID